MTMAAMATRPDSDSDPESGAPWPCSAPTQTHSGSGWPDSRAVYPPTTAEEVETHSALKIQLRACSDFRELFVNSDEDEDDEEEEEEEECWIRVEEDKFRFFLRVFSEDGELRKHYEANREGGEYCCFVCGGLGKGKRFRNCLGLAQHSAAMSKVERNGSHRAFLKVVCSVMGWDCDRIPSLVLKGEPLGRSLDNAGAEIRDESVGGGVRENVVAADGEKDGLTDDGKDHVECKCPLEDAKIVTDMGVLKVGGNENKGIDDKLGSHEPPVSNSGWSRSKAVEKCQSAILEWPSVTPAPVESLLTAEEKANLAADQLQYKAVRACQEFFKTNAGLDGGESESEDDEERDGFEDIDSEDEDADSSEDSKLFDFFSKLFAERVELREFYVRNPRTGDFCCLVCGGIGKKVWKRFTGCVALVQHSTRVLRTTKKLAHRAYGKVICDVLGQDIIHFPEIASGVESPAQSQTLRKSCDSQSEPEENPDCCKDIGTRESDSPDVDGVEKAVEEDSGISLNDTTIAR